MEEVRRVLGYKHIADSFNVTSEKANEYIDNIRGKTILVAEVLPNTPIVESDRTYDKFLVRATNGWVDCTVSGDQLLLRLAVYEASQSSPQ